MKTITIITEQISDRALAGAIPTAGVASVNITTAGSGIRDAFHTIDVASHRRLRNPSRFAPAYRIDLVVEDDTVATVFDGVTTAYEAGFFSDAEIWVNAPELALSA